MVKFDRNLVIDYFEERSLTSGEVTLTLTGEVDGTQFEGADTIRVIKRGKDK